MTERRSYSRHGLNVLKVKVKVRGLAAIDRRTAAARDLLAWKADLENDLGGQDNLSAQQRGLIDLAVRTRLYVDSLDAYIMEQPSLVNHRPSLHGPSSDIERFHQRKFEGVCMRCGLQESEVMLE